MCLVHDKCLKTECPIYDAILRTLIGDVKESPLNGTIDQIAVEIMKKEEKLFLTQPPSIGYY
jgi:hypothetical protein